MFSSTHTRIKTLWFLSLSPVIQNSALAHNKYLLNEWASSWVNRYTSVWLLFKWGKQQLWKYNYQWKIQNPSAASLAPETSNYWILLWHKTSSRHWWEGQRGTRPPVSMRGMRDSKCTDITSWKFKVYVQRGEMVSFDPFSCSLPTQKPHVAPGQGRCPLLQLPGVPQSPIQWPARTSVLISPDLSVWPHLSCTRDFTSGIQKWSIFNQCVGFQSQRTILNPPELTPRR